MAFVDQLVSGTNAGIASCVLEIDERNSGGSLLNFSSSTVTFGASAQRSLSRTLNQATTAFVNAGYRITFTTGAAVDMTVRFSKGYLAQAANGQTWTMAFVDQLVSGTNAGIASCVLEIDERNSGGSLLNFSSSTVTFGASAQRSLSRTLNQATTAFVNAGYRITFTTGAAVDMTVRFSKGYLAQVASFTAFTDSLSNSANAKFVAFAGGDLAVGTAAGLDVWLQSAPGLRETAKARRTANVYDQTWGQFSGVTTDATPTVFASVPIPEGKGFRFRATVAAVQYGGTATEKATYDVTGLVSRDLGGNVSVVTTTTTVSEVTASMDAIAQANTTAQTLELTATGKAATRIEWLAGLELYDAGLQAAA